ncbi:MAG: methyltransferase [Saprospiraceae bacterium]|nr:methyltransferase [Saprospiraceae bacterium]
MSINLKIAKPFYFKQFAIHQDRCAMKVGTDGVLLGAWADVENAKTVLDIGTGSGVIAVMLGQRNTQSYIHGIEIDPDAFEQAKENMQNAPWAERLNAFHTSIQDYAKSCMQRYDLIVSNPPFFSGGTFSDNQDKNNVRHTIKLPHGDLLAAVRTLLHDNGKFCVILPFIEGLRFQELAKHYHLYCNKIMEVYPKVEKPVERLLMQFEKSEKTLEKEKIIMRNEGINEWTEDYIRLTGAFYLYM